MPGVLPYIQATAVQTGADLIAELRAELYARQLTRLSISGPAGSRFELYVGSVSTANLVDSTRRGNINTAEYTNPIPLQRGVRLLARWPGVTGSATVTFHLERT